MFSQTAEYALRAMSVLAARSPSLVTTVELANATRVPPAYLSKVLQSLRKAGIVQSQRGIGGGVSLAKDAADITILHIINAVDPIRRITECPIALAAHGVKLCPMHSRLDAALATVEDALRSSTLADVLAEASDRERACQFPSPH
jgi:Rrf2 family protein